MSGSNKQAERVKGKGSFLSFFTLGKLFDLFSSVLIFGEIEAVDTPPPAFANASADAVGVLPRPKARLSHMTQKALIRLALTRDPPSPASGRSEGQPLISLLPLAGKGGAKRRMRALVTHMR
jgi:hypothetical protein